MSFTKTLGSILVAGLQVAAENARRNDSYLAEQAEADKWERRKQDVFATIDRALDRHGKRYLNERKAIQLRADATTHARNRSESLMHYTEQCAVKFEMYGY